MSQGMRVNDACRNENHAHILTHSPRCDATERGVPSGAILFAKRIFTKNYTIIEIHS